MTCLNCDKKIIDSDAEDFEQYCSRQCENEHSGECLRHKQMLEDLEDETNEED